MFKAFQAESLVSVQEINAPTTMGEFTMAAPVVMSVTADAPVPEKKGRHSHAVTDAQTKALQYKVD